jgi:hypothetical protein
VGFRLEEELPLGSEFFEMIPEFAEQHLEELDKAVTFGEFNDVLEGLRRGAAKDSRGLGVEILSNLGVKQRKRLVEKINDALADGEGIRGKQWDWRLTANGNCPLYKSGPVGVPSNYRFLSICPTLLKLVVTILNKRFVNILERLSFFDDTTLGFRSGLGTAEALLIYNLLVGSAVQFSAADHQCWWMSLLGTRKAFPSADKRCMHQWFAKAGISRTKWYSFMQSVQRDANHTFAKAAGNDVTNPPRDLSQAEHGLKEGCTSSVLFFARMYNEAGAAIA